jgi:hypothetical protein
MAEHRANDFFEQFAGKLVVQLEVNFAGILGKLLEMPRPLESAKWTINQANFHQPRKLLDIFRSKTGFDRVKINMQRRHGLEHVTKFNFSLVTPGQEIRVILAAINQFEHALG